MSSIGNAIKAIAKRVVKIYNIDESLIHEILDIANFARAKIEIKAGHAVVVAALYLLARNGADIAKYMPRHAPKRAKIAILIARMIAAKENRDDVDEFIRAYAYAIHLAAKQSLPPEAVEKAKDIIWNLRHKIKVDGDPVVFAKVALHNAMHDSYHVQSMPCPRKVKIKTKTGVELELVPRKVWTITYKVGLFLDPKTGKQFKAGVPQDYPDCP